jgi:WD40 repeat protein
MSRHSLVCAVAFSPDSRWALSAGEEGAIKVWDVHSQWELATYRVDFAVVFCYFEPDGCHITAADAGGYVHLLELVLPDGITKSEDSDETRKTTLPSPSAKSP